ncbi:UDP-N-acetylmuramate dehydrogenase [Marixanthomonas spongiae]|uniref:UDP-N-acetylenolpyruvoylglucosamine reductase n=1 Tax=Marixanthomonas spongiae TaxID=2174845 RepID=A0A2U0I7B3_9FLAO|nr:UDP-N-acetylmuramate dehydrogenase [Marixanthomonas spongiae]PVW16989.1 UDP-N-acetylenolpyruvoylglucosamine reductase [Marixanthomonas spongiae]
MQVEEHKSLKDYNTFGIDCTARYFVAVTSVEELQQILSGQLTGGARKKLENRFILGGGSNMLLTKDIDALVIYLNLKGIKICSETDNQVTIQAMAGENWHEFVRYCLEKDYGGLENLSLIPGNVGTAPIQNIGAYGVELKDTFVSCNAIEIATGKEHTFTKEDCDFGYRNSIFKNEAKGKYIIVSVTFQLTKKDHDLNTGYGAIQQKLTEKGIETPTIKDISEAVIEIRQSKLPDPKKLGNSGSFFKNPVVDSQKFQEFKSKHPEAPYYQILENEYKIPAGWLIEQAGFKGRRFKDAGVHENQALVLVNHGTATGEEIWQLALKIQQAVKDQFNIYIEPEVNII